MPITAILWDFGDTLADERWMCAPMTGDPAWPDVYRARVAGSELGSAWNTGLIGSSEVAAELAMTMGLTVASVLSHMQACSRQVSFYSGVMNASAACPLPQAIVTINPDIFSRVVVPHYRLASHFQAIVTSWEEGTEEKSNLCDVAMHRLRLTAPRQKCLLIDNRVDNVVSWRTRGGAAYHFMGEATLLHDLQSLLAAGTPL